MKTILLSSALLWLSSQAVVQQEPVDELDLLIKPIDPALLTQDRIPSKTAVPEYPAKALRDRIEGEVELCFNVDREGRPSRIAVRRSTDRVFERSAIRAVRASRYEPVPDELPVPVVKTCRTFTFSLEPAGDDIEPSGA